MTSSQAQSSDRLHAVTSADEQTDTPTPEAPAVKIGDSVVCTWKPEHVLLFPHDDSAEAGGYIAPPTL